MTIGHAQWHFPLCRPKMHSRLATASSYGMPFDGVVPIINEESQWQPDMHASYAPVRDHAVAAASSALSVSALRGLVGGFDPNMGHYLLSSILVQ